jgi:hypothetical protein
MSRRYPGHQRRSRRFLLGGTLASLGISIGLGADSVRHGLFGYDVPNWLWLLPFGSGLALVVVGLLLLLSVGRELRHMAQEPSAGERP